MDQIYYNKPDNVYSNIKDLEMETYEHPRRPSPLSFVKVSTSKSNPSTQTSDVSEPNSKQGSHRKFYFGTQVLLIVAVTIFATLSIVFMVMHFRAEGKSKPCDCQNRTIKNVKATSEPCDGQIGQNASRNYTEQKRKPCVCQNCSLVTNSCSKSKNYSMGNGQCPVGCVNSTIRKYRTRQIKTTAVQSFIQLLGLLWQRESMLLINQGVRSRFSSNQYSYIQWLSQDFSEGRP